MTEINQELVQRKVRQLFVNDEFEEAMAILDDYGTKSYHDSKDWVQIAVLKMSNGKLERLRGYMETARADYRDVLTVALEPNSFRMQMLSQKSPTVEEYRMVEEQDKAQWESWLAGNHVKSCEMCSGIGIVIDKKENDSPSWNVGWMECASCGGTGKEISV